MFGVHHSCDLPYTHTSVILPSDRVAACSTGITRVTLVTNMSATLAPNRGSIDTRSPMNSIETQNSIDILKTRHRLAVLQATLRRVERSTDFNPDDETFLEIKAMFERRIDNEITAIAQPAD